MQPLSHHPIVKRYIFHYALGFRWKMPANRHILSIFTPKTVNIMKTTPWREQRSSTVACARLYLLTSKPTASYTRHYMCGESCNNHHRKYFWDFVKTITTILLPCSTNTLTRQQQPYNNNAGVRLNMLLRYQEFVKRISCRKHISCLQACT